MIAQIMLQSSKIGMKKNFKIGNFEIKEYSSVFIIAEAGVNHNQNLDLALKLVDIAAESGANCIKFQTFKADDVVTNRGEMASYQEKNIGKKINQREMLKELELPEEFYAPIIQRCKERNILFMSTPHGGKKSVDFLESLGVEAYKIGSGDLTSYILLSRVARTGKPIILSSGMATMDEVKSAIEFVRVQGNNETAMLHSTTNYPTIPEEVNLLAMKTMREELDVPIGYSDNGVEGIEVAVMATALGAAIYECHFTSDKNLPGPDHIASANPEELKTKIDAIRKAEVVLGMSEKAPTKSEVSSMLKMVRKSIVASDDLEKGHIIIEDDLEAKRPGDGVSPVHYQKFLGKKLKTAVKKDQKITLEDIE